MTRYTRETIATVLNPELPRRYGIALLFIGTIIVSTAVWLGLSPNDAAMLSIVQVWFLCIIVALVLDDDSGGL